MSDDNDIDNEDHGRFGVRDLLGAVNLSDFGQMAGAEIAQIGSVISGAFEALPRLPFGPLFFFWGVFMAGFRSCLLVLVVVTFGSGILAITVSRVIMRLLGRGRDNNANGDA